MPRTDDKPTRRPTKRDDSLNVKGIFERIECGGRITLQQLAIVRQSGLTRIYRDIHENKLVVEKEGRRTFVRGDVARAYMAGEAMPRSVKGDDISVADNPGRAGAATFKQRQGEARMARIEAMAREIEAELAERKSAEGCAPRSPSSRSVH